jgi:hypothetical protein
MARRPTAAISRLWRTKFISIRCGRDGAEGKPASAGAPTDAAAFEGKMDGEYGIGASLTEGTEELEAMHVSRDWYRRCYSGLTPPTP